MLDIVYTVRHGDRNEELRYSLRSLQNLPHGKVWLAGHIPSWTQNVGKIQTNPHPNMYRSVEANLRAALEHPEVSDPFYLFNDDFFVMRKMRSIPIMHKGPVSEAIARYSPSSLYVKGALQTADLLRRLGIGDPLSYEMHAPLKVQKDPMLKVLDGRGQINCYHLRTVYGNLVVIGGKRSEDVKIYHSEDRAYEDMPLLSTTDMAFRYQKVGRYIQQAFPLPSAYEQ